MGTDVQTSIAINADVDLTDVATVAASNFVELYTDPWFVMSIVVTFLLGQVAHVVLRAYAHTIRNVTKALLIWSTQIVAGVAVTHYLVDAETHRLAWITGFNSIMLYYGLYWVAACGLKLPRVAKWLSLKETTVDESGDIHFGKTVQFIRCDRE